MFTDCWSLYDDGNHIDILKFYLSSKEIPFQMSEGIIQAKHGNQSIECEFDSNGHVTSSKVTV